MNSTERIILALDVSSLEAAAPLVENLSPFVGCFKIGLELITAVGAANAVNWIHSRGGKVFLDVKFHDIPQTMASAVREAAKLEVKMFNIHASAGKEALLLAVKEKKKSLLLAVTVLTSFAPEEAQKIYGAPLEKKVEEFALMAAVARVDGIVCSPQDLEFLKKVEGTQKLLKVTPGIRPSWAAGNDQRRSLTPSQAIKAGADYLVIGRPITAPPSKIGSSLNAVQNILEEVEKAS